MLVIFVVLLCTAMNLSGQEIPQVETSPVDETTLLIGEEEPTTQESVSPFSIWDLVRMIVVLGVVIAAIYLLFYLLRRAAGNRQASSPVIRVLGSRSLPGNRTLFLIEVGGQVFLVGSAGESISLISEISDKETVDQLVLSAGDGSQLPKRTFAEMIGGVFGAGENNNGSLDFMREQRDRLRKLRGNSDV